MSEWSIKVDGLSKEYVIGGAEQHYDSFRDMVVNVLKNPFKKYKVLNGRAQSLERFSALDDISFEIKPGERVGIIGHNGAGKSTLLKVLSRITSPSHGSVQIRGRVASLLEVGTGFHPELTGRENIFLNGSILGMKISQINQYFDEIVKFSGVGAFLDTPVKRYSSGMYVRLAFSVAAHLESDVLLVDEVLAVGDQEFQSKCLGKLEDVSASGRTVIFISHNLSAVSSLCERGILLGGGRILKDGPIAETLAVYQAEAAVGRKRIEVNENQPVSIVTTHFSDQSNLASAQFEPGQSSKVLIEIECYQDIDDLVLNLGIYDQNNQKLVLLNSDGTLNKTSFKKGINRITCNIDSLPFVCGQYYINFAVLKDKNLLDVVERANSFFIKSENVAVSELNVNGPVALNYSWIS